MGGRFFLYVAVTFLVIWALDSVNINQIFKKNRVFQARIFYFILAASLIYLVTNFFMDLFTSVKFIWKKYKFFFFVQTYNEVKKWEKEN